MCDSSSTLLQAKAGIIVSISGRSDLLSERQAAGTGEVVVVYAVVVVVVVVVKKQGSREEHQQPSY